MFRKLLPTTIAGMCAVCLIGCARTPVAPPVEKPSPPYTVGGTVYYPLSKVRDYKEQGVASWYGPDFHGRKTSSGETYDMYAYTAAHRILPFGTKVQVTNLSNGKSTAVKVNDRGPFVKNRIIDLSFSGAKQIGLIGPGTAVVEVKVVEVPESLPQNWSGTFCVQVGAFAEQKNALRLKAQLALHYSPVSILASEARQGLLYRVRVGNYPTLEATFAAQKDLSGRGYRDTFVVAE